MRGLGIALPSTSVSNADLEALLDTNDEWIVERSGIRSRRAAAGPFVSPVAPDHPAGGRGTTAALAIEAGQNALLSAGVSADEIGMLLVCTLLYPRTNRCRATSASVAAALGVGGGAMDVNAGVRRLRLPGLVTAAGFLAGWRRTGAAHRGRDHDACLTNWEDRTSAVLFGDGAGAAVLQRVEGPGSLLAWDVGGVTAPWLICCTPTTPVRRWS